MKPAKVLCTLAFVFLMVLQQAFAMTSNQINWSGGPGIPGPVSNWQEQFASALAIDFYAATNDLILIPGLSDQNSVTTAFSEPAGVTTADINGDGWLDFISVAFTGNEVAWWENDGFGGTWTHHPIGSGLSGPVSLCAVNLDDDDDVDIAVTEEEGHAVTWWENQGNGTTWTEHEIDPNVPGPFSVMHGDFDEDGDADLVTAAFNAGDIIIYENGDGLGTDWVKQTIDPSFSGAWGAVACYLDDDHHLDVAGVAFSLNDICWWENDGTGSGWTKHLVDGNFPYPVHLRTGDFNDDQATDVVAVSYYGQVAWWENDGTSTTWTKHLVASSLATPFSVRAFDLDGDEDLDILTNERDNDRILWFENLDSLGTLWLEHSVDITSSGPNDVGAALIDDDDQLDLFASHSWDHAITWYKSVDTFTSLGTLESSILSFSHPVEFWSEISWDCTAPPGTEITVAVRASTDANVMGEWTVVSASGDNLGDYLSEGALYFQYQVTLTTENELVSPCFEGISINWNYAADVGHEANPHNSYLLYNAAPNPSLAANPTTIRFSVPYQSRIELALYDLLGRKLQTLASGTYPAGEYSETIDNLSSGVYFTRLNTETSSLGRKIIIE